MKITVFELEEEDREQWEILYCGYAKFYQTSLNKEILDKVWSWIHNKEKKFYALIAKDETDKALGIMHYREMPSPLRGQNVGFLDDLFVHPDYRGKSVVDELFAALRQAAKNRDWKFIRWITADNNYRGRAVYDKLATRTDWLTYEMKID